MPPVAPARRLSFRRIWRWLCVIAMVGAMVGSLFWMNVGQSTRRDAQDAQRETGGSLERSQALARHQESELEGGRAAAQETAALAREILELDRASLELASRQVTLWRQLIPLVSGDDFDRYNASIRQINATVDQQNALSDEINRLVSELTGQPILPSPSPEFASQ